jgi:hypothetical protein
MKRLLLVLLLPLLSGCATVGQITDAAPDVAKSPNTFIVCKAADVGLTAYALHTGLFIEKNPFIAPLIGHKATATGVPILGHIGAYMPLIAVSAGLVALVYWLHNDSATLAANAVTCPVSIWNFYTIFLK